MSRNELEMSMDVLRVLANGKAMRKTRIAQATNTNYAESFIKLFHMLEHGGLIQESDTEKGYYDITKQGLFIVKQYASVATYMKEIRKNQSPEILTFEELAKTNDQLR